MAKNKTKQIEAEAKEAIAVPETARLKFRDIGKKPSTESKESESSEETAKQSHRIYYNPNNIRR